MIDGIEELYQQIGVSIHESIPEDWSTATVESVFFPGMSQCRGEYIRKADGAARGFEVNCGGCFRQARKLFKEAGKPLWGQATFVVESSGKFKMTWGYDNCDENCDTIFDEDEWVAKTEARNERLNSEQ